MKIHCLFEQSGTFKNEFIKLGYCAEDYDIMNEFNQTDHVVDLYKEIEGGYEGNPSIFDDISRDDLILAFFPCIRFENQIMLGFRGQQYQQREWTYRQKMEYDMKLMSELEQNYVLVNKLFIICIDRGLKLVMENPYSEEHFLRRYWCYPAAVIDKDRRGNGDFYAKPTQYWFLNFNPKDNLIFEPITYNAIESTNRTGDAWRDRRKSDYEKTGAKTIKVARSMMHPDYANRFIRRHLIEIKEDSYE